ncbi:hypothetical protein GWC77_24420 [Paraburkholderia sp. NMBU_R16]|uniref:hypothetical protein n=1 Tax=Paraburkholderia sp. NMBU_R16 TaxID=2698676 RepID=UPI0015652E57|nr:hypothetical protein [Paraburkholderia sp. NMBU_R16]NRO99052.1 hypothetical protein [Paraburkholderia sp. NMBU_R16]
MKIKIIGYCALGAIALALFVTMCAILRDAIITHDINAKSQADGGMHVAEGATTVPALRAKP